MKSLTDEEFITTLIQECKKQNIELDESKAQALKEYKELLIEWNEKMNLTAITEDYEVIIKHFVDCLECTHLISNEKKIIDVGTGAGFPGMPLAIYYPQIEFTLLDGLNKRLIFLEEVVNKLGLKNVKIVHARAEEAARNEEYFESFDAVVSRAVANLPVLLEYTSPYVKVNGKCIVMKGDNAKEELDLAKNAMNILKLKNIENKEYKYSYTINNEEYNRTILYIEKVGNTPNKYPRNYGQIKKKAL
ncbi:MAG: 16S rRNA (guanine(527)-N(7))-methyltransferase RsmG [Clostridia bacterium]|nr:16S rRNA (guanine(527)-N(7))-methyltransferase RsmG [Clostridia bacterium]